MNLKTFAQQARTILMRGVENRLRYWGFTGKGADGEEPAPLDGGYMFRGEPFDDPAVPALWRSLKSAIARHGFDNVMEEAAYTWFNRIMAIHILSKNGYEQPLLSFAQGLMHTPAILQQARQGHYGFLNVAEQQRVKPLLADFSEDSSAFAILLIGYCHSHPLISRVFGGINDYTELLLPDDMLSDQGFLHLLNTTDAIPEAQYREVELIGWLYQFYISKKKDEVFAGFKKNRKAEAAEIPAATQIFTPNWIVKYMVENTVGMLWLDLHPGSPLKAGMRYLVEGNQAEYGHPIIREAKEIKLLDPACGSGHILVEGFDLLFRMYKEEYYADEEAVASILQHNLFGLDIDKRAAQLARFALLLKAAQVFPAVLKRGWLPNIFAIPEACNFSRQEILDFLGRDGMAYEQPLTAALSLMQQAQNLGSIMRFDLPEEARTFILNRLHSLQQNPAPSFHEQAVLPRITPFLRVMEILTDRYEAVAANPPYMGQKNMNGGLKAYVNDHYPISKSDLFAVFMEICTHLLAKDGLYGMINQQSWMFLSSYEALRKSVLEKQHIRSMLHLGPRTFDELSGEVVQNTAFVIENEFQEQASGNYFRLVDYRSSEEKHVNFINRSGAFLNISQTNFSKIPGHPIAYWESIRFIKTFNNKSFETYGNPRVGMQTSNNDIFLRRWYEVNVMKSNIFNENTLYWIKYIKGGRYRKWYGNNDYLLKYNWDGGELLNQENATVLSQSFLNKLKGTWTDLASGGFSSRIGISGSFNDISGHCFYPSSNQFHAILGLTNTKVFSKYLSLFNSTLHFQVGDLKKVPVFIELFNNLVINYLVKANIETSKGDWDSRETSWDFRQSPILAQQAVNLEAGVNGWLRQATSDFFQLHANEEELNRIFIEIYGLQDELTPEVALKDITILQDELDYSALEQMKPPYDGQLLPVKRAVVMQQLISYAVGCFMGRYRLDKPGLHIAHPNPGREELASYSYHGGLFEIDEDAIVPLMGSGCYFADDAVNRFKNFLDQVWGAAARVENINFIEACLDEELEKYMVRSFWKEHCRTYQKRPVYWLFASPKGAFQVLVYMHRMNGFTVEKIRSKYLLEHLKNLRSGISMLEKQTGSLSAQEARTLDKLRKNLQECEQYDILVKDMAYRQIVFDLDDGVTENYKKFGEIVAEIK